MQQNVSHPCNVFRPRALPGSHGFTSSLAKALQEKASRGRSACDTGCYF